MGENDDRRNLIQRYLSTRRRIREIGRIALEKLGSNAPMREGPVCAF